MTQQPPLKSNEQNSVEGILLVNKPKGQTSFSLVAILRRVLGVKKIGHAGTLDPFATGVMVMLVGRNYTRLSDQFLVKDKEYLACLRLGITTDTFDCEGEIQSQSDYIPSEAEIHAAIAQFQGEFEQTPPMFSAKKVNGKKLYELARKGIEIERKPVKIRATTELVQYEYPYIKFRVLCSSGTYIRSIGHDIGQILTCGGHLTELQRTKSGSFLLEDCVDGTMLKDPNIDIKSALIRQE